VETGVSDAMAGTILGLGSSLSWALTTLVVRTITREVAPAMVNGVRTALAAVMILIIVIPGWINSPPGLPSGLSLALMIASVMTGLGFGDAMFFESLRRIGVSRAMPVAMSFPLITTLLGAALLGETLSIGIVLGTLLVIAGVVVVVTEATSGAEGKPWDRVGYALAGVTAISWGVTGVLVRPSLADMDVLTATAVRLPVATLLMCALVRGQAVPAVRSLTPRLWGLMALAGLLSLGATLGFVAAIQMAGAGRTASLSATSPIFAAPLAALLLREGLTPRVILGTVLSAAGVWLLLE
jgi:drug/metabolite transporter (DMT)-like permease